MLAEMLLGMINSCQRWIRFLSQAMRVEVNPSLCGQLPKVALSHPRWMRTSPVKPICHHQCGPLIVR
jgi:hypothetical protein